MNFWHNLLGSFLQWYLMITVVALLIVSQTTFVCPAEITFADMELAGSSVVNALKSACGIRLTSVKFVPAKEHQAEEPRLTECIFSKNLTEAEPNILATFDQIKEGKRENAGDKAEIAPILHKFYAGAKQQAEQFVAKYRTERQFFQEGNSGMQKFLEHKYVTDTNLYNLVLTAQMFQYAYATMFEALRRQIATGGRVEAQTDVAKNTEMMSYFYHHSAILNYYATNANLFCEKLESLVTGVLAPRLEFDFNCIDSVREWKNRPIGVEQASSSERCKEKMVKAWLECQENIKAIIASEAYAKRVKKYQEEFVPILQQIQWQIVPQVGDVPSAVEKKMDSGSLGLPMLHIDEALQLLNGILGAALNGQSNSVEFLQEMATPKWHGMVEEQAVQQTYSAAGEEMVRKLVNAIEIAHGTLHICCLPYARDAAQKQWWLNEMSRAKMFVFAALLLEQFERLQNANGKKLLLLEDDRMQRASVMKYLHGKQSAARFEHLYLQPELVDNFRKQFGEKEVEHFLASKLANAKAKTKLDGFMHIAKRRADLTQHFLEQYTLTYQQWQLHSLAMIEPMNNVVMTVADAYQLLLFIFLKFIRKQPQTVTSFIFSFREDSAVTLLQAEIATNARMYSQNAKHNMGQVMHVIGQFDQLLRDFVGNERALVEQLYVLTMAQMLLRKLLLAVEKDEEVMTKLLETAKHTNSEAKKSIQREQIRAWQFAESLKEKTVGDKKMQKFFQKLNNKKQEVAKKMANTSEDPSYFEHKNVHEWLAHLVDTLQKAELRETELRPYLHVAIELE